MSMIVERAYIVHDQNVCTACGICELMCSLYHEDLYSPSLSRSRINRQPFTADHEYYVCQQCQSPECYEACPLKDSAIYIDTATGIVYINEDECTGCGECVNACPFDPPRITISVKNNTAFKCDLCKGREDGPICIEYCPFQAIKLESVDER